MFLINLFFIVEHIDFASCAEDDKIYNPGNNIGDAIKSSQLSPKKLFGWFSETQMKGNSDKCNLILNSKDPRQIQIGSCN